MALEAARFTPDDQRAVVLASLSCARCLHEVEWGLRLDPDDPLVHCRCRGCGAERDVFLTPEQALRLALDARLHEPAPPLVRPGPVLG